MLFLLSYSSTAAEERYKVKFDYMPENDDELALHVGDVVVVTDKNVSDGWWEGSSNGKSGFFPNNFLEETPVADAAPKDKVFLLIFSFMFLMFSILDLLLHYANKLAIWLPPCVPDNHSSFIMYPTTILHFIMLNFLEYIKLWI